MQGSQFTMIVYLFIYLRVCVNAHKYHFYYKWSSETEEDVHMWRCVLYMTVSPQMLCELLYSDRIRVFSFSSLLIA